MTKEREATHYHRLFDCPAPVLYSDGSAAYCACPEPIGDFENGYTCELGAFTQEWHERANANPLNMDLFLRCRYAGATDRLMGIAAHQSPLLQFVSSMDWGSKPGFTANRATRRAVASQKRKK